MKKKICVLIAALTAVGLLVGACGSSGGSSGGAATAAPAAEETAAATEAAAPEATEAAAAPASDEKEYTFKFAYAQAEQSFYGDTYGYFCDKVTEYSNGTIKFEMYPSNSLVDSTEVQEAVMSGNVEFAHFYTAFHSNMVKDFLPFEIPGAYEAEKYDEIADATFDIVDSIFADYNCKYVAQSYPDPIAIASAKGIITTKEELQDQIIRVPGAYTAKAFDLWGAKASTINLADVTTSVEKGTVDGVYTGWMMVPAMKFHEVAPHVTVTTFQNSYYGIMMNLDVWNELSDNQREAIEKAAVDFHAYSEEKYQEQWDTFTNALEESGGDYAMLPDELSEELKEQARPLFEEIKPEMTDKGRELVDILASLW